MFYEKWRKQCFLLYRRWALRGKLRPPDTEQLVHTGVGIERHRTEKELAELDTRRAVRHRLPIDDLVVVLAVCVLLL